MMNAKSCHLVSFASSDMIKSLKRLEKQALAFNFFETLHMYTEEDLDPAFRKKYSGFMKKKTRGYGFWLWKPTVILQALGKIQEGHDLLYIDAGCHLNIKGKSRLEDYFQFLQLSPSGVLAFQNKVPVAPLNHDGRRLPDLPDRHWIKGDLLDYFGVRKNAEIIDTQTIGAGILLVKKIPKAVQFLQSWEGHMRNNLHLLDNSPSNSTDLSGFREHRHDQAFFSVMAKSEKIPTVSACEYWYPKVNSWSPDWDALANFPIHAKRDKDFDFFSKLRLKLQKIWKKLTKPRSIPQLLARLHKF